MRRLCLAVAIVIGFTPAVMAQLPPMLDAALSIETEPRKVERIEMRITKGEDSVRFETRPAPDSGTTYTLLEPAEDALNEAQREIWEDARAPDEDEAAEEGAEEESASLSLTGLAALRGVIGTQVSELGLQDGLHVFGFTPAGLPGSDETPRAMLEALSGEVAVDPETGALAFFRFFAEDSFKPNIAARIDDFEIRQSFIHDPELGGPRPSVMTMSLSGSAAFQRFEQSMKMETLHIDWAPIGEAQSADLGAGAESP
ncbi:MAG: hypothetical protein ABL308_13535 [Oceanicaulis sp.]